MIAFIILYLFTALVVAVIVARSFMSMPTVYTSMPLLDDFLAGCVGVFVGVFWPVLLPSAIVSFIAKLLALKR